MTYELFYGSGGHGGPYPSLDVAKFRAVRQLLGSKSERRIEIHERTTGQDSIGGYGKQPVVSLRKADDGNIFATYSHAPSLVEVL